MPRKREAKKERSPNLGGKRPNAGRKPGGKNQATIEKEKVLAQYRQNIMRHAEQIFREQKAMAFGSYELFIVEHYEEIDGKIKKRHVRVDDPELMANILDDPDLQQGDNYVLIRKVEPDKFTLDSMLDRAFGKAAQVNENINTNYNTEVTIDIDEAED